MRRCIAHQRLHEAEVRGVSFTGDGRYLASAGFDKNIVISSTSNKENIQIVKALGHNDKVVSVKWHPFLPLLLSTSADKSARVWVPSLNYQ